MAEAELENKPAANRTSAAIKWRSGVKYIIPKMRTQRIIGLSGDRCQAVACNVGDDLVVLKEFDTRENAERFISDMADLGKLSVQQKEDLLALLLHAVLNAKQTALRIFEADEEVGKPGYATKSHMSQWAGDIVGEIEMVEGTLECMIHPFKFTPPAH